MKKTILLILLLPMLASAQYFDVFDIDTTDYPIMKAKFYSIDANGKQILNHTPTDFEITENGEPRDVISVSCPAPLPIPISVGIMVDTYRFIDIARKGSEQFVEHLIMPQNEIGITYMDRRPLVYQDFTNGKVIATQKSKSIPAAPGYTQVEKMLFDEYAGGVNLIKTREAQNRVLIFISDLHCPNLTLDEQKLFKEATENNIRIYTVLINTTDYTGLFGRIANETNGILFENVKADAEIENIFEKIAYIEQTEPCELSWESDSKCTYNKELNIVNKILSLSQNYKLRITKDQLVRLELNTHLINFGKMDKGETKDTAITVSAHNKNQIINEISLISDFGYFEILNPLPISILEGESIKLNIRYTAIDTSKQYTRILLTTDDCEYYGALVAGSKYQIVANKTLNLTHPNGGEVFIAGSDTTIRWEGISENENVNLKFSSNNGRNWNMISHSANNLKEFWKVPNIRSDSCQVQVNQIIPDKSNKGEIDWSVKVATAGVDQFTSVVKTTDGGFIATGFTESVNGKGLVIKLDKDGKTEWLKELGAKYTEWFNSICETTDGDYVICGTVDYSFAKDSWIVKIDSQGNIIWEKTYGGSFVDEVFSVKQTFDGGFIFAGMSMSNDLDVISNKGKSDAWILKLNSDGEKEWSKSYGGSDDDYTYSVYTGINGNYFLTGTTKSTDGDIEIGQGNDDIWVLKIDQYGEKIWSRTFGGTSSDVARDIIQSYDGGIIIAGSTASNDGIFKENTESIYRAMLMKLDIDGNVEWLKIYINEKRERLSSVKQTSDGGFILSGSTTNNVYEADPPDGFFRDDIWVSKVDNSGNFEWSRRFGGTSFENGISIVESDDGSYVIAGHSSSDDFDLEKEGNIGQTDAWIFKMLKPPPPFQYDISDAHFSIIQPDPFIQNSNIDMGEMIVGNTKDTIVSSVICNLGEARLHVLGVDITGGDINDFLIPRGAGNFYLNEGECQDFMLEFTPTRYGARTAVATIRTTVGDFIDTIKIRGFGIYPSVLITTDVVDFGKVKLGLSKDTTVFIIENRSKQEVNITNTSIIGPDFEQFEILSTDKSFTIPAESEKELQLSYVAQYMGKASSRVEFEYDDALVPLRSMLFAEGINHVVQTIRDTIDFGEVKIGTVKDTNAYLIKNISESSIDISDMKNTGPDFKQFSIQEFKNNFIIEGYDSLLIKLRFEATIPGNTSTIIVSYNNLTSTKLETVLLGKGVGGVIQPMMEDAFIAENTDLELHLNGVSPRLLSDIATNFSATVSYNSTLLAPIDKSMSINTKDNESFITITGKLSGVSQIAAIPMKVGLGTAVKSGLVITEFQLYDANGDSVDYDIEPGVGEFNVLGICEEGGVRLINPNGEAVDMVVTTDGFNNNAKVNLTLIETGQTELTIFDQIGNKVETVYSGTPSAGSQEINLDLSKYANGRYYIKLTTPTITKTEIIEVVR